MSNKTSDKNVANIEDDVDELKSIMNLRTDSGFAYSQKNTLSLQKAIKNVLADYTRQKQINEEHQKINGELREKVKELEIDLTTVYLKGVEDGKDKYEQKIKDKIEEYYKKMEEDKGKVNWIITDRIVMNVLEELLQESEEK